MGFNPSPIELKPKELRKQNTFKFFSPLCGREVIVESLVEYIVWLSFEFDRNVKVLCERPAKLEGRVDGKEKSYRPDLFVRTQDNEETLVECKKHEDLIEVEPDVWQPKRWDTMSTLAEQISLPLRLVVDSDFVPLSTAVNNWREALPFAADESQRPRHALRQYIQRQFEMMPTQTLGELAANTADWEADEVHSAALWWAHQGPLDLEWNAAPLGRDTVLRKYSDFDWCRV